MLRVRSIGRICLDKMRPCATSPVAPFSSDSTAKPMGSRLNGDAFGSPHQESVGEQERGRRQGSPYRDRGGRVTETSPTIRRTRLGGVQEASDTRPENVAVFLVIKKRRGTGGTFIISSSRGNTDCGGVGAQTQPTLCGEHGVCTHGPTGRDIGWSGTPHRPHPTGGTWRWVTCPRRTARPERSSLSLFS